MRPLVQAFLEELHAVSERALGQEALLRRLERRVAELERPPASTADVVERHSYTIDWATSDGKEHAYIARGLGGRVGVGMTPEAALRDLLGGVLD